MQIHTVSGVALEPGMLRRFLCERYVFRYADLNTMMGSCCRQLASVLLRAGPVPKHPERDRNCMPLTINDSDQRAQVQPPLLLVFGFSFSSCGRETDS
jgi:hypothetical protein